MYSALAAEWGSFVSDKYKIFLYAPPKCASTSILTALVTLVDPEAEISSGLTSENLSSLDIHPYVRDHYAPTKQCIVNAFENPDYCKILVLRDPLSRFLSAISSKYLIGTGPYARELTLGSSLKYELKKDYSDIQNLKDDVNFVSKRLLTALSMGKFVSHARPLSDLFSKKDLLLFDNIFNVSDSGFSEAFLTAINLHLHQFGVSVAALPRINESPLSIPADLLELDVLDSILEFYQNDYLFLGKDCPKSSDILDSDFDICEYAQRNSDKLSSSVLFYDVSSKFFQKILIADEQRDKALGWTQNLKLKIKQLKHEIDELTEQDKYRILHIAQLQEDLLGASDKAEKAINIIKKQQQLISTLFELIDKISSR